MINTAVIGLLTIERKGRQATDFVVTRFILCGEALALTGGKFDAIRTLFFCIS